MVCNQWLVTSGDGPNDMIDERRFQFPLVFRHDQHIKQDRREAEPLFRQERPMKVCPDSDAHPNKTSGVQPAIPTSRPKRGGRSRFFSVGRSQPIPPAHWADALRQRQQPGLIAPDQRANGDGVGGGK